MFFMILFHINIFDFSIFINEEYKREFEIDRKLTHTNIAIPGDPLQLPKIPTSGLYKVLVRPAPISEPPVTLENPRVHPISW